VDWREFAGWLRTLRLPTTQLEDRAPFEEKPDTAAGIVSGEQVVVGTIIISGGEGDWKAGNKRGGEIGPVVPAPTLPGNFTTEMSWAEPAEEQQLLGGEVVLVVDKGVETSGTA